MITLGGNVCIRNGSQLDYTWREAVSSLLPVCEEVVVCDGESTDGTQEEIREWMKTEPKIKLCVYPWPNPKGDETFWTTWLNFARLHITSDFMCQLDADEILHESSYEEIEAFKKRTLPNHRVSLWCKRLNFWRDAQSLIPYGHCCSDKVVRIAPQSIWMPSDGSCPEGATCIALASESGIVIGHYGFLRRKEAFFEKAKALQSYFFNGYDQRLADVERDGILKSEGTTGNWMTDIKNIGWINDLVKFEGTHPALAIPWLKERGYLI